MLNKVQIDINQLKSNSKLDKVWIVGHNVISSDMLVLYSQCKRESVDYGKYLQSLGVEGIIDTLKIARTLNSSSEGVGLAHLYKKYTGRELDDAHDALADAKATATLLKEILKDEANSVRTYTLDSVLAHLEHLHQEHAASAVAACANDQKSLTVKDKFVAFGKYKGKPVADLLKETIIATG